MSRGEVGCVANVMHPQVGWLLKKIRHNRDSSLIKSGRVYAPKLLVTID